jgi:hypothetical protein
MPAGDTREKASEGRYRALDAPDFHSMKSV